MSFYTLIKKKSYNTHIVRNETPLNFNIYMTHEHCQNRNSVRQKYAASVSVLDMLLIDIT